MKIILIILLLSAVALLVDLPLAGGGLVLVAVVLLIGNLIQGLPGSACNHHCEQGGGCTCTLAKPECKS